MAHTQQILEREVSKSNIELSSETQVFLSFKCRTSNRYKLLDKLVRANIDPDKQLTDKTIYLSEKAKKIFEAAILKLLRGKTVALNHKYLSKATLCKSDQNYNILKELRKIFDINYHRLFELNGRFLERIYHMQLHPAIIRELKDAGFFDLEFYPDFSRDTNTNKDIFNEDKDIDLGSNFLKKSESKNQEETSTAKIINFPTRIKKRLPNQRKKPTNSETKAKVIRFNQYHRPRTLAEHYPLNQEDSARLQSKSGREFTLNATNEILLYLSRKPKESKHKFPCKAAFMAYMIKALQGEMRDAVKISGESFRIKANITQEEWATKKREKLLDKKEQKVIDTDGREDNDFQSIADLVNGLVNFI